MPETKKKRIGRPPVNSTSINLRLPPDLLAWVDAERARLDPEPSRPEFIRQLIEARKGL
ncbi:ribbon-helix-helix protein, CopG family [Paracoccus sp. (in: a-proteobacteria)]|uniref:ribbon-helix-helix protein, CopG family n=1 Tax=Paracoccus sp. TaxID=267 RepID=UPI003A523ABD